MSATAPPRLVILVLLLLSLVSACAGQVAPVTPPSPSPQPVAATPIAATCGLAPVVAPTPPAVIPGYTELDPTTNLHVTGTMQVVDLQSYRLRVTGRVENPLALTFEELRCLPKVTARPALICPGYFMDEATWAGASLEALLKLAGVQAGARSLRMVSADGFANEISLARATANGSFLAYEWEGQPLPRLHGFPVRTVFPGEEGNLWVK
ncbi:MAG: molybdopterin-dependent oxidoreductase [Chloroflexi bacterium]|nr:molybdopterin-dependent oxidoreductase [Chloroflexota bacterium]MCL5108520.1 molybdopterin-dependent oxidoreductase [Chloroflexota bacterium]